MFLLLYIFFKPFVYVEGTYISGCLLLVWVFLIPFITKEYFIKCGSYLKNYY